jgi:hypothetical protein
MKAIQQIFGLSLMLLVMVSFSHCSSTKKAQDKNVKMEPEIKLQEKVPFEIGEVNFQRWTAGIQGGGSGIHLHISVLKSTSTIVFDSVYFRGLKAKIEIGKMDYYASFETSHNQKEDIRVSSDPKEEYGNQMPKVVEKIPFELKDNECVISYKKDTETYYYKIENLVEKEALNYPSTPPNKQ